MRHIATYTPEELVGQQVAERVEWFSSDHGPRVLIDGVDWHKPGLGDWIKRGGIKFLLNKAKGYLSRKAAPPRFVITAEIGTNWRRTGHSSDWRKGS